jgi:hypothetical protein
MKRCPVCRGIALVFSRTRWWTKDGGRVVWRRAVQCRSCDWRGWVTGSAGDAESAIPLRFVARDDSRVAQL